MILAILLLLSGLAISGVAIYYSVVGLTAIFAAAAIPIMIMGVSLEVGKLVIASWVKAYWDRIPFLIRAYAVTGVTILMIITSLGIFGFLSKAHSDQTLVSGDGQARIAVYDEKIRISRDNIEANRRALRQMDEAVDQSMARSADEKGADKAVAIRRSQQRERGRLQSEIQAEQTTINKINEEAAPIRAENRKIEAEVGPIKYIAAFVYGDNPDATILERAVTWVIILIVVVFDPLAIVMLLAAQMTWQWYRDDKNPVEDKATPAEVNKHTEAPVPEDTIDDQIDNIVELGNCYKCNTALLNAPGIGPFCPNRSCDVFDATNPNIEPVVFIAPNSVELPKFEVKHNAPLDVRVDVVQEYEPDPLIQELASELETAVRDRDELAEFIRTTQSDLDTTVQAKADLEFKLFSLERDVQVLLARIAELETPVPAVTPVNYTFLDEHSEPESVHVPEPEVQIIAPAEELTISISETAPKFKAETLAVPATVPRQKSFPEPEPVVTGPEEYITDPLVKMLNRKPNAGFGTDFPDNPTRGDMFLRTDFRPTRLFKWNDTKWIETNKNATDAYSYNDAYIHYLAEKLLSGEYQLDDLTEVEQQQVQVILGAARG